MSRDRLTTIFLALGLLAGAFAVKWWYRDATVDELGFVLRPVSALVAAITGGSCTYAADQGYLFPSLGIRIDRSCSGINFLVIATASFALLILRRTDGGCARPFLAVLAAGGAYLLTIVANSGRIVAMVWAERAGFALAPRAHEAVGAFFFLASLLVAVALFHRALPRTTA